MIKEILVNVGDRETRIAVIEDGRIAELHIEREERIVGNLIKARVENIVPSLDAAFVDCGLHRNAFLYVGDILPDQHRQSHEAEPSLDDEGPLGFDEDDEEMGESAGVPGEPASAGRVQRRKAPRRSFLRQQKITEILKVGQELLVQVTKGPRGTKGARVSTRVSLPGRFLVLMPEADNIGISRKIVDNHERDRLRRIGDKLRVTGFGIIIRTEAEDKSEADLIADRDFLLDIWKKAQANYKRVRGPALVHQDLTIVFKTLRDLFGTDVQRLLIDSPGEYEAAAELIRQVTPRLRGRVHLYTGTTPLFTAFGLEAEIERSLKRKVWLKSGGYLIIDETEALTVIDVNTGKFTGASNLNDTIVRTNIDAANEIARQLRLRDIGGIIVIDFIDMNNLKDRQAVVRSLENALKRDRSRTKISNISPLGLVEMTRKRTTETIASFLSDTCPHCGGRGFLPSPETTSLSIEREILKMVGDEKKSIDAILVKCHPSVAEVLIGEDGETIDRLERQVERAIFVRADDALHPESYDVSSSVLADLERRFRPLRRAQVVDCVLDESKLQPDGGMVGWVNGYRLDIEGSRRPPGQSVKAKINEPRRSFATAVVVQGGPPPRLGEPLASRQHEETNRPRQNGRPQG